MERPASYSSLKCETVSNRNGTPETIFTGETRDGQGSTEFSGVLAADGSIKGNLKISDGDRLIVSANTDGSGYRRVPELGSDAHSLAEVAKEGLAGPAKACNPRNLPFAPKG